MCSKSEATQRGTHTNTHAWGRGCVPGANWQQQSYLWAGLGWGQGQNQEVWRQDCTVPPNRPCKCKNDTHRSTIPAAVSFSHPETVPSPPCRALTTWIPVKCVGQWSILETLGCYETWGRVTETDKYFSESKKIWEGRSGFFSCIVSFHAALSSYVRTRFAQTCKSGWQKETFAVKTHTHLISHKSSATKPPIPLLGYDFSSCNPSCLVCNSELPIGTALPEMVSCNDTWL